MHGKKLKIGTEIGQLSNLKPFAVERNQAKDHKHTVRKLTVCNNYVIEDY